MTKMITAAAIAALTLWVASPSFAAGNKTGFDTQSGQGNLSNENVQDNSGTTTVKGPRGQLKQGSTDCNNCTVDKPGKNR